MGQVQIVPEPPSPKKKKNPQFFVIILYMSYKEHTHHQDNY